MPDETVDFRDLLNKPLSDFPDRPQLPGAKTFYGKLLGIEGGHSKNKGTPYFRFHVRLTDPGDDAKEGTKKIVDAGFSLADYQVYSDFYITPNAMVMLRRFLTSLGFSQDASFSENLKLDPNGNPTAKTVEVIRGLDIVCRTQAADDQGRVFQNLDMIAGRTGK